MMGGGRRTGVGAGRQVVLRVKTQQPTSGSNELCHLNPTPGPTDSLDWKRGCPALEFSHL